MLKLKTSKVPHLKQPVMIFSVSIQNNFLCNDNSNILLFKYQNLYTVNFYLPISDKYNRYKVSASNLRF